MFLIVLQSALLAFRPTIWHFSVALHTWTCISCAISVTLYILVHYLGRSFRKYDAAELEIAVKRSCMEFDLDCCLFYL